MVSPKLQQIMQNSPFWNNTIDIQLKNATEQLNKNTNWWFRCQSKTLSTVLNNTLANYYAHTPNAYLTLYTMCALLHNNLKINIYAKYKLITAETATTLSERLYDTLDMPNTNDSIQNFNIIFYHIPKGKSYLKEVLDKNTTLIRLRQIEAFCIENPSHFIRIYKNFNNTGHNTITIFSNQYTPHLINTIWIMLPHLMEIVPRRTNEDYTLTEEDIIYNNRVKILHQFFNELYEIMKSNQSNLHEFTDIELTQILSKLANIATEYANCFDFTSEQLDTFTKNLAKARNDNAHRYFTNQLNDVTNTITNYENLLTQRYIEKSQLERKIATNKLITEDDVKPFMDTIKNTKAIEIMHTSDSEIVLRITAPLQYFESGDFEAYERNTTSTFNLSYNDNPIFKRILHKVFITREYQILFQGIIYLKINMQYDSTPLDLYAENRTDGNKFTQFPNPHLFHYNCWGKARNEMQKNMTEGNFELVVMQMVAAVQSMNIAENASFNNGFLNDIKNYTHLRNLLTFIVQTPTGKKQMNYDQIIEYERELEKQETIQKAQEILESTPKQNYVQIEIPDNDDNWNTITVQPNNEENRNNEEN